MKLNLNSKILYLLTGLYLLAPNAVYAKNSSSSELKTVIAQFLTVMIGVAISSFIIYVIFALYNKFFVSKDIKNTQIRKNSLNPPRDKDEAITKFIVKNRLK